MAELASGAITSLLGVIRDEALLLSSVRGDVQFIKEEMESMNCFMAHLARTVPPGGEHDEQVRGWMNQIRLLAQDCNNCIGIYRYHGDPDIHRARDGLWRYIWWLPWFVKKMVKQHDAAIRLRELKDRAREVGERRSRYGVEVPAAKAVGRLPPAAGSFAVTLDGDDDEDGDEDEDYDEQEVASTTVRLRRAIFEHRSLDDYFREKLVDWIKKVDNKTSVIPSIAVVAPSSDDADKLADEALAIAKTHFKRNFKVHLWPVSLLLSFIPLTPSDVLYYVLHEFQQQGDKFHPQQEGTSAGQCKVEEQESDRSKSQSRQRVTRSSKRRAIRLGRINAIREMRADMKKMKIQDSIEKIKSKIDEIKGEGLEQEPEHIKDGDEALEAPSLYVLWRVLCRLKNNSDAASKEDQSTEDKILSKTATMLEEYMGRGDAERLSLHKDQYEDILKDVFLPTIRDKPLQADQQATSAAKKATMTITSTNTSLGADQIREIIDKVKLELRQELQEYRSHYMEQATTKLGGQGQKIPQAVFEETKKKFHKIQSKIEEQLTIKWMLDKNKDHWKDHEKTLIIMLNHNMVVYDWEDTLKALNLLGCIAGVMMVITTQTPQRAEIYCSTPWVPVNYSRAGQYYDRVLQLSNKQMKVNTEIFRDILEECEPYDECWMKIFAHSLFPKRSNEELRKLHLQISKKSSVSVPMKMFKFSYSDLPKEYRSCLFYLAIFPPKKYIRRSTLIGRWVVEGLITKEDWPSSVREANRCFDVLIDRCLINPIDIGATGNIKRCMVSEQIHQLITKIARSQHIVETRLSEHLAHHFSIFNDLRLCGSDRIDNFFKQLIFEKSQLPTIKVLDLEGCDCSFKENPQYLAVICNKLLLLKYLSLRGTDITKLPNEINKLHELEVLDIRQTTSLPAPATKHVVLLKLKHLLADTGSDNVGAEVWIPEKIRKMENMEILSNVRAPDQGQELKDIGRLWKLRKFGVVIDDKESHVKDLLEAISNLHASLRSLSITILPTTKDSVVSQGLEHSPKHLESLRINGTEQNGQLLPLLAREVDQQLRKVTLSNTSLNQNNLEVLSKLKKLRCLKLRNIACTEGTLTFKKNEFSNLNYFLVEGFHKQGSKLTEIIFDGGAAVKLEKIVLSKTGIESFRGVDNLPKLRELEFNGNIVPDEVRKVIDALTNKQRGFVFKHNNAENHGEEMGNEPEKDDGAKRFLCF